MLATERRIRRAALLLVMALTIAEPPAAGLFRPAAALASPRTAHAVSTADHTKFDQLKVHFSSGPEVTKACLSCHTEAARQVQATMHWTWNLEAVPNDLGKRNIINNY